MANYMELLQQQQEQQNYTLLTSVQERQRRLVFREATLVCEPGVLFLQVRRVRQHEPAQVGGAGRAVNGSLESLRDQSVDLGGGVTRRFSAGERIHTENSYKYAAAEFEKLLGDAGFGAVQRWSNAEQGYFVFYAS